MASPAVDVFSGDKNVSSGQFFSLALVTAALGITGSREVSNSNYFVAAFYFAIPLIGWLTFALKSAGWLT